MKSAPEITARIKEIEPDDVFGTETGDLLRALPFEQAKPFLRDGVTPEEFAAVHTPTDAAVRAALMDYLPFALGKATGHRGLSAARSISHLRAWTWLLDDAESVALIDGEHYRPYGMPILKHLCTKYGVAFPANERAERMGNGQTCADDCDEGC